VSRKVHQRWELTGTLVAESPVRVGNVDVAGEGELRQARDGLDRPVLPGTALAGVIRAGLADPLGDSELWGRLANVENGKETDTGHGSWVTVDDATAPGNTPVEQRDTTSIDRITGAVARGHLFTQETLPAGARFDFRIAIDDEHSGEDTEAARLLAAVVDLLAGTGVLVGAATSRGFGRLRLTDASRSRSVLATRAGMLQALRGTVPSEKVDTDDPATLPSGMVRVRIKWRPRGPLMVRVAAESVAVSAHPQTTSVGANQRRLVLPGSSLKGVLRSHAERIMRTVHGFDAPEKLLDQLSDERLAPVIALFGTANESKSGRGRRGALTAHECLGRDLIADEHWTKIQQLKQPKPAERNEGASHDRMELHGFAERLATLNEDLGDGAGIRFTVAHHVAIDRWTGGAADNRLFAVLEPEMTGEAPPWEDIVLDIDTRRVDAHALTLLLLLLRDLCDGWFGIGYGTTRGNGAISVSTQDIEFTGTDVAEVWLPVIGRPLDKILADETLVTRLTETWPPENGETP
jgi:CRISPR/Cas system CSM-associated protein Csm3 (group 7 of RAMP superfamily)